MSVLEETVTLAVSLVLLDLQEHLESLDVQENLERLVCQVIQDGLHNSHASRSRHHLANLVLKGHEDYQVCRDLLETLELLACLVHQESLLLLVNLGLKDRLDFLESQAPQVLLVNLEFLLYPNLLFLDSLEPLDRQVLKGHLGHQVNLGLLGHLVSKDLRAHQEPTALLELMEILVLPDNKGHVALLESQVFVPSIALLMEEFSSKTVLVAKQVL